MTESPDAAMPGRHFAVVPAAGTGTRLAADRPKQYLDLNGATMLERTVEALLACSWLEAVLVVVAPDDAVAAALPGLQGPRCSVVPVGGDTRRASVLGGLAALADARGATDSDWVWVHDAARPGVEPESLARLRDAVREDRVGGLLAQPVADTVKRGGAGRAVTTVEREGLWLAQTPQVFPLGTLRHALERHHRVTDEASAIEATGRTPLLVAGSRRNFKVTTMDDLHAMRDALAPAAAGTDAEPPWRIGQGWDVHALVPGRALVIGGTTIPHASGLLGHSDADVLLHAITDALLGGAGLGDIGRHFPDTDARFAGADSRVLLREALQRVRAAGWRPANVDCTVVAQAPKLAPHVPAMVEAIAADLGLPASSVNVKAKTSERLGYAGRGEGISAQAVVMLARAD
ncbi:MAG: 2-C-methyl-D-erythritol 2,4-cyclodiphosphate synthase [Burkholderiales bacterium]|jgi:2-C-methyl-D-erythritol 4-phosphate cytidylyltransferase/2-C-methyl-D-erythritol 2,4-cyclodiphosphate synthase